MEKLKFAFQVFTTAMALPLLSIMEMNHNKKMQPIDNAFIEQRVIKNTGTYYSENSVKISSILKKKDFNRTYFK